MYEKNAQIIESQVGDGFAGEDYDRGWHDATKRIAIELANYFAQKDTFFDRRKFMKACGLEGK